MGPRAQPVRTRWIWTGQATQQKVDEGECESGDAEAKAEAIGATGPGPKGNPTTQNGVRYILDVAGVRPSIAAYMTRVD